MIEDLSQNHDVYVVAPDKERSSIGHAFSLKTPITVTKIKHHHYTCSGYPADCVYLGLLKIFADIKFDLVISGINHGANLGQDTYYSGTVAAAREAVFRGIPAFAMSLVLDGSSRPRAYFETAISVLKELIQQKAYELLGPYELLNVNVPNCEIGEHLGMEIGKLGIRQYHNIVAYDHHPTCRQSYYLSISGGVDHSFPKESGTDVEIVSRFKTSLSPLKLMNEITDKTKTWNSLVN